MSSVWKQMTEIISQMHGCVGYKKECFGYATDKLVQPDVLTDV